MNRAYATSRRVFDVTKDPCDSSLTRREVQLALPVEDQVGHTLRYKLRFPYLPPSKNVYDGWDPAWKHSMKRKWMNRVAEECEAMAIPKGTLKIGLAAVLVFSTNRRRDLSNYSQTLWNFIPDGLQRCGVLVDDREDRIRYPPNLGVRFKVEIKPGVPKTHIERTLVGLSVMVP